MFNQIILEHRQQLSMTPEMLQSIKMLQMTSVELAEYIEHEFIENPVLEEVAGEREYDEYERWESQTHKEDEQFSILEKYVRQDETLYEYLMSQLGASGVSGNVYNVCEFLIYSLDSDGYLRITDEEIKVECGVPDEDINTARALLQSMEPVGIGARTLEECLEIQLKSKGELTAHMQRIISELLEDVADNHVGRIASVLKITKGRAQEYTDRIKRLEPKPGCRFSDGGSIQFIIPDVIVEFHGDDIIAVINRTSIQNFQISSYYLDLAKESRAGGELNEYLWDKIGSARRLLDSLEKRNNTILRVSKAIIENQRQFFMSEAKVLRPLTLQKIADELDMHLSTVSRAIDGKYMQVGGKLFPMKHFFGSGYVQLGKAYSADDTGSIEGENVDSEEIAATSIKQIIKRYIENENPKKPLSDQKMTSLLNAIGINISRRTVAKYREAMGIKATSKRKRF